MDGDIKYGVHGKSKSFERRSRPETFYNSPLESDSLEKMMVVGKSFTLNKSRSISSGYQLHECHSDTAVSPLKNVPCKKSFYSEGLQIDVSEYPSGSSISFASAMSDASETLRKKLLDLEGELSGKNATISHLRKQLNDDGDKNIEFTSVAVETDLTISVGDDYQVKLNNLLSKIKKHEQVISELSIELEGSIKGRGEIMEENRNLVHEMNLLHRQLQSMYELIHSKCDNGIDPNEFLKLNDRIIDLEDENAGKDELIRKLENNLKEKECELEEKTRLLVETTNHFTDYKDLNVEELTELNNKIFRLEREADNREKVYTEQLLEAHKCMEDKVAKVEAQCQEDLKEAVERCRNSFKKLSDIPKNKLEGVLRLCETGKFDVLLMQRDWEEQRMLLERKIKSLREEKNQEIDRLVEGYESKISNLNSRVESLSQQLKERKETLDAFESELKMYREEKAKETENEQGSCDLNELKQLHKAEILSQQEKHKLEKDLLEDKVKNLSEEILSHANNEKIHLQELQIAKTMASTFRKKYEMLLAELEENIKSKKATDYFAAISELDLENTLRQFKALILSLKKAEEIHDSKISFLKKLDQEEMLVHQREINVFKVKLEQIDRFQSKLLELDKEIKGLIKSVEMKYANTVQSMSNYHISEVKLKQLEIDSLEQKKANEICELRKKMKGMEESNELLQREIKDLKQKMEDLTVELLRNEGMLDVKAEIEEALLGRIKELEVLLEEKNNESQKELENKLAKFIAIKALVSAKEEIVSEYEATTQETEIILKASCDRAGDIEKECLNLQDSFNKLEETTKVIYDISNCENYLILRKNLSRLDIELKQMYEKYGTLEEGGEILKRANSELCTGKEESVRRCQDMQVERDMFLENYKMIDDGVNKVMNEVNPSEGGQADFNFKSVLDKIEKIGLYIIKSSETKSDSCTRLEERERAFRQEREDMCVMNDILGENLKILRERVDSLLFELLDKRKLEECSMDNQVLLSEKDEPSRTESESTFIMAGTGSTEALKCILRCDALSKENRSLRKENSELKMELKEMEMQKENELERQGVKSSFREEMICKMENIQREILEVINENSALTENFKILENERNTLRRELAEARNENSVMQTKLNTELNQLTEPSEDICKESLKKEMKMNQMRIEMERLMDCVKTLSKDLDRIKRDNEKLMLETKHHLKSNQCLKNELEEAWTERHMIQDQLANLRRENALLNVHRDQLEQTNKRISKLISEGAPSVVSWMSIHETVENIVDIVQALKSSFDLPPSSPKTGQNQQGVLHLELENKTKLCQELVSQKLMLERELETLESLMKSSKSIQHRKETTLKMRFSDGSNQNKKECSSVTEHFPDSSSEKEGLKMFKLKDQEPYLATLHRLKKHFEAQVQLQEAQLTEALATEVEELKKQMHQRRGSDTEREIEDHGTKKSEEKKTASCEHEIEVEKLREIVKEIQETGNSSLLIHEMESKHGEQMEELRRYFEKKCAELEKNFSEDVYNQQSRKASECDLVELGGDKIAAAKEDVIEKYRAYLEEEGSDNGKNVKFLNIITEIVSRHAEELNFQRTKHEKEMANIQKRHLAELNQVQEEVRQLRKTAESEREMLIKRYESRLKEVAAEERKIIALDLEREYESKVKQEIRKLGDLLLAESRAQEKESSVLEESCMEKLSEYQTESALKKIEIEKELERRNEEKFRKELEEEKIRIAQYYKDLNEAALRRFNEEQENMIKSHSDIVRRLIQEHEERIMELKRAHKQDLEKFHCDEEIKLAMEFRNKEKRFENELSSMKSTYEDELLQLKKCCQDTLNEQVCLAKADAFNILQKQIQDYLNGDDDGSLEEVKELGEKFAGRYRREIEELKKKHHGEVTRMRTEYEEKIRRRYSTGSLPKRSAEKMEMRTDDDKLLILRERDALQEMVTSLRHVLSELIRYVGSCEVELNSTIVGEYGCGESTMYKSLQLETSELNEAECSSFLSKRVHFTPDLSSIISDINDSRAMNTSAQVRTELDRCLKQLKSDASHLLALSNPARKQDENIYELLEKMEKEKEKLLEKVGAVEEMQKELKMDVNNTKGKLAELERSREVVKEGYGEEVVSAQKQETFIRLKEKAKALMGPHCTQPSDILNVLDEICKEGDRLQDEARREKHDLQQQVAAADKQLRATRKFLEEQAAEREVERDDYTNEIKRLTEVLRVRERDKSLQERMNEEVKPQRKRKPRRIETLENQLRDVNERLVEAEQTRGDAESKLKDAVEKIWTLREIIRDLEGQVANHGEKNSELLCRVEELETAFEEQEKMNRSLMVELENFRTRTRDEHDEHVKHLEEELATLRQAADRLSTEAIMQMRVSLREIELSLTKKTKDLEQLLASSANVSCSSPCSEDISVCERLDATGCPTPDEMQEMQEKVGLPLEEIDRIQEKLVRHTRAEEVAIKTVRDLQMQLKNNKKAFDEVQIERDVLLERADTYLQENSRLKVRLDEQRCNAGIIQKQLNADLESQIKRLEYDIEKLNELCIQKDKQIRDMNHVLQQTTKSLKIREAEVLNKSNEENEIIKNLKTDLINALEEKRKLEENISKLKESLHGTVSVPVLMETMLEEKNAEIDRLEREVAMLSKQRAASSLIKTSTDSADSSKSLKRVKFTEPDSFVQIISPILPEDQSVVRCAYDSFADLKLSSQKLRKSQNWVTTPESLSSIGALQLSPRGADTQSQWNNSHALLMSSTRHDVRSEIEALRRELSEKSEKIKMYECERTGMDAEIDEIRDELKSTMDAVQQDKCMYKKEFEKMMENESNLRSELESRRREISEQLLEIDTLKRKLAEVNLELETTRSEYKKLEGDSATKDEEINKLKNSTESLLITIETLKRNHLEEVEEMQNKLNFEHNRVESVLDELKILEVKKVEIEEEFLSLKEDYNEKLNSQERTVANLKLEVEELNRKNKELTENYERLEVQMDVTLTEADKLSEGLTNELVTVKNENGKLMKEYLDLKNDLDNCVVQITEKAEAAMQTSVETNDFNCQTEGSSRRAEVSEEMNAFQASLDKLRTEMNAWEQRMDEKELDREEILSYAAIVRTLISRVLENLDDHFYELQTYRKKMMECSVDDLTDKVQKELLLSAKLDSKLLSKLQTEKPGDLEECESTLVQDLEGDSGLSKKKQNLVNVAVSMYELETNLQEIEMQNKEFKSRIELLTREKNEEKKRADQMQGLVRMLEESLAKERMMLAEEKGRCEEDAKIMEVLRMNFELFVEKVDELERALHSERQHRLALEKMLKSPEGNQDGVNASELQCQLEIERQKCVALSANVEKEKRKNQALRIQLEQEKLERVTEKDLKKLLNKDLALLQEQKTNLESKLTHTKEVLKAKQTEINALKRKVNLQEIDIKALTISNDNQLEKDTEMSMMAEKVSELEKELEFYRQKVQSLSQQSETISAPLLMKMQILDNCVEQHVQESNEMGEAVLHLTQETEQMRTLIKKIEERTENGTLSNSSDETVIVDVEAERKTWLAEKERLAGELEKMRCDYEVLKKETAEAFKSNEPLKLEIKKLRKEVETLRLETANLDERQIGIPEDRVLHLFGKYMREESYRKALAYQKLYLMSLVKGYENEEDAFARICRGGSSRRKEVRRRHLRSRRRFFKVVAFVIIAVKRMQFMRMKWSMCRITAFHAFKDKTSANKENKPIKYSSGLRGPIDPLRYQTHNLLRKQMNVMRTPPSRDPDSRPKHIDKRRANENIERPGYLNRNLGLPHPP